MELELHTTKATRVPPTDYRPNIILIVLDALNWTAWQKAAPKNIPRLLNASAMKAHSFACCTLPALVGFLSNYPPIGVGYGLFERGTFVQASDLSKQATHHPTRAWMPKYYKDLGYHTSLFSGNAVIAEADQEMGISEHFDHWGVKKYLQTEIHKITPRIIKDFTLRCRMTKDPLFSILWLFDTHFPFSDGRVVLDPPFRDGHATMKACVRAMKYTDMVVVPAIVEALQATSRDSMVIITSDHGENHGGIGTGHNPFSWNLRMSDELFAIPFIEGILKYKRD